MANDESKSMAFRIGVTNDGGKILFQFTNQDDGAAIEVEFSLQSAKFFWSQLGEFITKAEKKPKHAENLFKSLSRN